MFFCSQYWPILPIYVYVYFLSCDACRLLFVHLYCNRFKVTAPVFEKSLVLKEINVTFLYSLLTQCKKVQVIVLCLSVCLYVSHFTRILLPYTMAPLKAAPSTPHPPPPPPPPSTHWHCYRCSGKNITKWNIYGIYLSSCFELLLR